MASLLPLEDGTVGRDITLAVRASSWRHSRPFFIALLVSRISSHRCPGKWRVWTDPALIVAAAIWGAKRHRCVCAVDSPGCGWIPSCSKPCSGEARSWQRRPTRILHGRRPTIRGHSSISCPFCPHHPVTILGTCYPEALRRQTYGRQPVSSRAAFVVLFTLFITVR